MPGEAGGEWERMRTDLQGNLRSVSRGCPLILLKPIVKCGEVYTIVDCATEKHNVGIAVERCGDCSELLLAYKESARGLKVPYYLLRLILYRPCPSTRASVPFRRDAPSFPCNLARSYRHPSRTRPPTDTVMVMKREPWRTTKRVASVVLPELPSVKASLTATRHTAGRAGTSNKNNLEFRHWGHDVLCGREKRGQGHGAVQKRQALCHLRPKPATPRYMIAASLNRCGSSGP